MPEPEIRRSDHFARRLVERGIDFEDVCATIGKPNSKRRDRKGDNGGWVWNYEKTIEGKRLFVAAEVVKKGNSEVIILMTVFRREPPRNRPGQTTRRK